MNPDEAEIQALKKAVAQVKEFIESTEAASGVDDLIITAVTDYGDLWWFSWNNAWPLLGQPHLEYPDCHPIAVFKSDARLVQVVRAYSDWIESGMDGALALARVLAGR